MTLRIRLLSDIHLEFRRRIHNLLHNIPSSPDEILVLAGDIGHPFHENYPLFLSAMSEKFRKIFLVSGNHEYYSGDHTMDQTDQKISALCSHYKNITFLHNTWEDFEGFRWLGTTLWTEVPIDSRPISDAIKIKDFSIEKNNSMHREAKLFLEKEIPISTLPCIVITHHMPSFHLIQPKYLRESFVPYNCWYASSMDHLFTQNVKAWCYGHTHMRDDRFVGYGTRLICNPIGYPGENDVVDYQKTIDLKK